MRLWEQFDRMVVFDTETTGIDFGRDRIIEIGAVSLEGGAETGGMDLFLRLPEGRRLDPFITQLTGITQERLEAEGVGDEEAARAFTALLAGAERPLLAAYNAQFDLNFLYDLLRPWGLAGVLRRVRLLDVLTVYRDRRDYPHKLENAIAAYRLEDRAVNSHRAIDDARAAALLLGVMAEERDDLERYVGLFGTHPKYGRSGRKISSVTYRAQPYDRRKPLYELP
nr:3'-5' exonuclease [uncultured Oscillibacter sp.]